ncbi:cytochrome c oxidase subunit CcoP [Nonlabens ulvanivorans]|uniref:Cytochrome c oxidase subunit CcoP n=1 Tax=Nonlabens ulvanivorans TaxID=906888 RepID=A0A090WL62_NONUL|nr:cbb3-type cytochrome c oxidase N-terminal domain-containing protein [Nonlabens ulvanivorans]GAL76144.1 cytochrome c oxidase subunit CcoP [Nonlabens ulvanivorans]
MNKSALFRIIIFMILALVLFELVAGKEGTWAVQEYPLIWLILGVLFLCAYLLETSVKTLERVLYNTLSDEAKERYDAATIARKEQEFAGIKKTYAKMLGSKPIEDEGEIELDHNYDGIRELDNNLPPWWVYLFYATILFGVVYLTKYHVFDIAPDQAEEYLQEVAVAEKEIVEYKKTAKNLIDVNTVTLLTDASDLKAGKSIFQDNCIACHKADGGGGIGPNLTDRHWILGGGIKNVFNTISEGGRDGKGMVSWKADLSPSEMAQVASYVMSFQGTTPAEPKEAEGEIWEDPDAPKDVAPAAPETQVDSTAVTFND